MVVNNVSFQIMSDVVHFVYTGAIDHLTEEKASDIQKCARKFSMDSLVAAMELFKQNKCKNVFFIFLFKINLILLRHH
jgi:hypothetical protein